MRYLQITFKITPDTELARELLVAMAGEVGCDSFSEEENVVMKFIALKMLLKKQL